jgi:hypothetical protein
MGKTNFLLTLVWSRRTTDKYEKMSGRPPVACRGRHQPVVEGGLRGGEEGRHAGQDKVHTE